MRMTAGQYNKAVDEIRRLGILPGDGIQLGRYSAGTAVSVSPGTVQRRAGTRRPTTAATGFKSILAIVTARVTEPEIGLEWRHAVMDGNTPRIARPDEVEYIDLSMSPGNPVWEPLPQEGFAINLRDTTVLGTWGTYFLRYQVNPWTPIAGDVIRVYIDREGLQSGLWPKRWLCDEYKPVRSEKIFVTWDQYVSSTAVRPAHYWLDRSLIGEPDTDGIVTSPWTFTNVSTVSGLPRQTGMYQGIIGTAGRYAGATYDESLLKGSDSAYTYGGLIQSASYEAKTAAVTYTASGKYVVAWWSYISGLYQLRLRIEDDLPTTVLYRDASAYYVQHLAVDSSGIVHILSRDATAGGYLYVNSDLESGVPTTTTSPCALAISPSGVPTILGKDSAGVWGFMQRIGGRWVTTALASPVWIPGALLASLDIVFTTSGDFHYGYLWYPGIGPIGVYNLAIGQYVAGVQSESEMPTSYAISSRARMAIDARGYPVYAVSRLVSGNNYECDLWIWKRDGLNDTYQSETLGNPYQLGGVHVVNGRGYNQ